MSLTIGFAIVIILLLVIGNDVNTIKRELRELDEKLGHLKMDCDAMRRSLEADIEQVRVGVRDLKYDLWKRE